MRAEPTYATPRSPERYSDGPTIGAGIETWQGRRPTPWQQAQLDVALERIDGPGSPFAFDEVIVVVGRRCGKTVTSFGVPLIRALAGPVLLPNGRRLPFRAVHVAQNISAAQQRFAEDLVAPYRRRFTDTGWAAAVRDLRSNGNTRLTIDPRRRKQIADAEKQQLASELRVLAPTGNSARGAGVFHRTYDEELTYSLERGQELTEAGRPTMAELGGHGQTWHVSNVSREIDRSRFLWHQRQKGRAAVAADRREGVCYVEFSLPPGVDPDDEREWWRYYPALGDGIVGIEQLRRDREEWDGLSPGAFAAEYLGRWPDENETGQTGWHVIELEAWLAAKAGEGVQIPADAAAAIGVDIDPFGRSSSIVAAARVGPQVLVEVLEHRPGSDWLADEILRRAADVVAIGIDSHGSALSLLEQLRTFPVLAPLLVATSAADLSAACYQLDAGLREGLVSWLPTLHHDALSIAAAAAERTAGYAWYWERRVSRSQTPLVAATLAMRALTMRRQVPDPEIY